MHHIFWSQLQSRLDASFKSSSAISELFVINQFFALSYTIQYLQSLSALLWLLIQNLPQKVSLVWKIWEAREEKEVGGGGGESMRWRQGGPVCLRAPLWQSHFLSGEMAAFCYNIDCFSVLIEAGLQGWMPDQRGVGSLSTFPSATLNSSLVYS